MARNHRRDENWITNMYQKIEATFQEIDEFVYKEPVLFVGNQVQTVCRNVKKFYSDVMQDLILSPKCIDLAEGSASSVAGVKDITTVRRNVSKPKEAPVVPEMRHQPSVSAVLSKAADQAIQVPLNSSASNQETVVIEKCDEDQNNEKSSELVDTESSQSDESYLDALLNSSSSSREDFSVDQSTCNDNKYADDHEKFFRELYENHKNFSEQLCDDDSGSGTLYKKIEVLFREKLEKNVILSKQLSNATSQSDDLLDLVSEDGYFSMEEKKFDVESDAKFLRELLEKKKFCNVSSQSDDSRLVNGGSAIEGKKLENGTTSSKLLNNESSQSEGSVSEDGDWGIEDISDLNVGTEEQVKALSSCFESVGVEPDTIDCNPAEGRVSISSCGFSSCEPVTALDTTRTEESVSIFGSGTGDNSHNWNVSHFEDSCWSEIGGADKSTVDSEELIMANIDLSENKELAESCVMVDGKLLNFPHKSKGSRSYKKIIQDAFMSKRRLTKEYEQLSVLYGDIDKEFKPLVGNGVEPKLTEDLPDSEWEIL